MTPHTKHLIWVILTVVLIVYYYIANLGADAHRIRYITGFVLVLLGFALGIMAARYL